MTFFFFSLSYLAQEKVTDVLNSSATQRAIGGKRTRER
jgi:hypothetical protein